MLLLSEIGVHKITTFSKQHCTSVWNWAEPQWGLLWTDFDKLLCRHVTVKSQECSLLSCKKLLQICACNCNYDIKSALKWLLELLLVSLTGKVWKEWCRICCKMIILLCFDCLTGVESGCMWLIKTFFPSKNMKSKVYVHICSTSAWCDCWLWWFQFFFFFLTHLKKSCLMFTQCLPNGEK